MGRVFGRLGLNKEFLNYCVILDLNGLLVGRNLCGWFKY